MAGTRPKGAVNTLGKVFEIFSILTPFIPKVSTLLSLAYTRFRHNVLSLVIFR